LVISAKLAEILGVKLGDELSIHALEGEQRTVSVPVVGLAEDFAGIAAYMELHALNRLLLEGDMISGAHLSVSNGRWREFLEAAKVLPKTAGVTVKAAIRESFRKTTAQS